MWVPNYHAPQTAQPPEGYGVFRDAARQTTYRPGSIAHTERTRGKRGVTRIRKEHTDRRDSRGGSGEAPLPTGVTCVQTGVTLWEVLRIQ